MSPYISNSRRKSASVVFFDCGGCQPELTWAMDIVRRSSPISR
jgi:hypothetical protein